MKTEEREVYSNSTDSPVVGIVADPDVGNLVAGMILRASAEGLDAIVAAHPESEAADFANRLGATVVYLENDCDPREALSLSEAAAELGYPGVIFKRLEDQGKISSSNSSLHLKGKSESRGMGGFDVKSEPRETGMRNYQLEGSSESEISMDEERSVIAVIPAHDEEKSIEDIIKRVRPYVDKVLVVDDSSNDDTGVISKKHADGVVTHPKNMGVGGAVYTGYQVAINEEFDVVLQIDADGQHDPECIPAILKKMDEDGADMVIGSRWLNDSFKEYSLVRRAGIKFFTIETILLGGLNITDVTSGFRAYNVDMLEDLGRPESSHWALEQTLEAARKGFKISEISIPMPPSPDGSQFDLMTFIKYPPRMVLITLKILLFR